MSEHARTTEPREDHRAYVLTFLAIGLVLSAVHFLTPGSSGIRAALGAAGLAVLLACAVYMALLGWRLWQRRVALDVARRMVDLDAGIGAVTDPRLRIVHRNPAAAQISDHADLTELLAGHLASPDALLQRLVSGLRDGQAAGEVMMTSKGPLRISATALTEGMIGWRIALPQGGEQGSSRDLLPVMSISPAGRVLELNQAMQEFYGGRPTLLEHLFDGRAPISGRVNHVRTKTGHEEVLVATLPASGDRQEIVLIPGTGGGETGIRGGWDAVEELPVPLLKVGLSGEILASNREARELLRSEVQPGTQLADLLEGLGRPMDDWLKEAHNMPGRPDPQFLRGGGVRRDMFLQVALCKPRGGDVPYMIAVLHNVTEFKALEAQFVQSQKMQAIGQLAGGVAHDFNNLLTAISGHCDLLLLRHTDGDPDYSDLSQIRQNTIRAAALVRQLLAFSRKQDFKLVAMDLRDSLADLTHLLNRLVGEKVSLMLTHDPAPLWVKADKRQLEQVIMNLVVNARDALSDGGEVRIEAENVTLHEPLRRDRATLRSGDYIVVRVIDNGCGIPPEIISHVFEPFYTTKGVGEGTGLGLSTAYGIVKQLGGFIFVDSQPGEGTSFAVYLPSYEASQDDPAPVSPPKPTEAEPVGGSILLVEDEAPVRAFAARALRMRGYQVHEADCAEAALEVLEDGSLAVDLFVTDVVMPGMDGPTWVRAALKDRPDTKVIFMSGYSEESLRETRAQIPNSAFLAKPFSLHDLTQLVQDRLAQA